MEYGYKQIARDFKEIYQTGKQDGIKLKENPLKELFFRVLSWIGGFSCGILFCNWLMFYR